MAFNDITRPKANKEHRCIWCGEGIYQAETHVHFTGSWQGEFQDWRMHNECYEDAVDNDGLTDGFTPYEAQRPAPVADKGGQ